ncbi:unnamed protein product [Closterium sp. Naga37s-1]|nr:unnamed protein product [Closterium sp. Naga37s-1]
MSVEAAAASASAGASAGASAAASGSVSSAQTRPTALELVSVASAPSEVAHTRRPPASGNAPGSPLSTPSKSRSVAALAPAAMDGGKAGIAGICGGARWLVACSAVLVLLLTIIVGCATRDPFYATHWTKWNASGGGIIKFVRRGLLALPAAGPGPLCDLYHGQWVQTQQPAYYSGEKCGWISTSFACARSNRPLEMRQYERLRWQPNGCNMTRFSAEGFFSRMRKKSIAFVGDSLGQEPFQSLLCMLAPEGPPKNMSDPASPIQDVRKDYGFFPTPRDSHRPDRAYRFVASNTTVIFRWSTTLCEIEPLNKENGTQGNALHLDRPDTFLRDYLKKLDVVVLNTGHHWDRVEMNQNALRFYLNGTLAPPVNRRPMVMWLALKTAVRSVCVWIDDQLKQTSSGAGDGGGEGARQKLGSGVQLPGLATGGGAKQTTAIFGTPDTKPMVFLRSISPRHSKGDKNGTGGCVQLKYPLGDAEVASMTTRDAIKEDGVLGTSVRLLNTTHLSAYRGDAHPAGWDPRYVTAKGQDCLHWCLPGVPDMWNELVYTHIVAREG